MSRKNYTGDGYYYLDNEIEHYTTVSEAKKHVKLQCRKYGGRRKIYRNNKVYGEYWFDKETDQLVGVRK